MSGGKTYGDLCRTLLCFPDGIVPRICPVYIYKVGCTMKKVLFPSTFATMAVAANASEAADSLKVHMEGLTTDVNTIIGPAAIGLAVAVAMVVVGRAFIKKFFRT